MHFIPAPNRVTQKTGFYISYNNSIRDYGDVTTAIVIGEQMDAFYILLGDHRDAYEKCGDDLEKCIEYFVANIDKISEYSDRPGEPTASERIAEDLRKRQENGEDLFTLPKLAIDNSYEDEYCGDDDE